MPERERTHASNNSPTVRGAPTLGRARARDDETTRDDGDDDDDDESAPHDSLADAEAKRSVNTGSRLETNWRHRGALPAAPGAPKTV